MVLLVVPDWIQVNRRYEQMYRDYGFVIPQNSDNLSLFQERLEKIAEKNKIYFFDALPGLKKFDRGDLYYVNDPHLNERGREVIAGLILNFLKIKGLIN
jgi:hypothetical protein